MTEYSPFKMKGFSKHATGPRAKAKPTKPGKDAPLSPGFEDPIKIQRVQREGLTPNSQKFNKKARANTPKAKAKRLLDHVNTPAKLVKPKKSKVSAHGQLNDAEAEYKEDKKLYRKAKRKLRKAKKVDKPKKPTFRKLKKYSDLEKYDDDRG